MKIIARTLRAILLLALIMSIICSCKKDNTPSNIQPTSIQISESSVNLTVGGREKLIVSVEPSNADLSIAAWTSADTNIIKVDKDGIATAISAGETTITYKTDNNLEQQCKFKVVASPVSGIVLPQANYPIGNGLKFIIQGTGFTASDKIWFRKASYSTTGIKSSLDGDDILGEINELAGNYINVSSGAENGWYSVYLEDAGILYNLGNLEFSTYHVPAYVFDPTKNYWEDTQWRMMQLRGHVKEMMFRSIHQGKDNYLDSHSLTSFNEQGFKIKELVESDNFWPILKEIKYDNQNRITKYQVTDDYQKPSSATYWDRSYSFTYGTHGKFFPINMNGNSLASSYWNYNESDFCASFDNGVIWEKGLIGIQYTTSSNNGSFNFSIDIYSDSIVQTRNDVSQIGDYSLRDTFIYNGVFPSIQREYREHDPNPLVVQTYAFSSTGMPIERKCTYPVVFASWKDNYVENSPISIYSEESEIHCEYDGNFDLISTQSQYQNINETRKFYYTSYDVNGNWTECIAVLQDTGSFNTTSVWTITRDFTYWE
ncbi:Ig-like domain-containing protein [Candidatus Nomurabacteria bacterium]|nr:Ig-like domain-containing protein [Candidatus Nomurabacteria bacterium]